MTYGDEVRIVLPTALLVGILTYLSFTSRNCVNSLMGNPDTCSWEFGGSGAVLVAVIVATLVALVGLALTRRRRSEPPAHR